MGWFVQGHSACRSTHVRLSLQSFLMILTQYNTYSHYVETRNWLEMPGPCQPVSGWGGVFQNLGPLPIQGPLKKIFRKAKFFPENVGDGGGVNNAFRKTEFPKIFRKQHFSRNFQRTNPSFFKNFAILPCQGPLPASWAPLFYFFWGCYTPHTPPRWHGPANCFELLWTINPYYIIYYLKVLIHIVYTT